MSIWFTFGDRVICDRTKNKRFFTWSFSLPKCLSCLCLPYLLALRSLHTLAKKECYACLYFPRNPSLIVLGVALPQLVFIVAINADWLTSLVLDSQYASYLRCENFSAMCPPVHAKSLQNVWSPSLPL